MNTPPEFVVISTCSVATFVWSRLSETTLTGILVHPIQRDIEQSIGGRDRTLCPGGDPGAGRDGYRERPQSPWLHRIARRMRGEQNVGYDHMLLARRAYANVAEPRRRRHGCVVLVAYADHQRADRPARRRHELRPTVLRVQRGPWLNPRPPAVRRRRAVVRDPAHRRGGPGAVVEQH